MELKEALDICNEMDFLNEEGLKRFLAILKEEARLRGETI